jgi:hypothetical protein
MPKPKEHVTERLLDQVIRRAADMHTWDEEKIGRLEAEKMALGAKLDDLKRRLLGVAELKKRWGPTERLMST